MEDSEEVYAQYELVAKDLENGVTNQGVWAKAFADSNGDEPATKALYMKLMVARALQDKARAEIPRVRASGGHKSAPQASVINDVIASQPESMPKFEWSSMPWLDRFAMIMLGSGVGAFIAATVTTLAMGMRLDLLEILFARTTGPIYLAAFIGFFVLLFKGYFRRSSQLPKNTSENSARGTMGTDAPVNVSISREEHVSPRRDGSLTNASPQKVQKSKNDSSFNPTAALGFFLVLVVIMVLGYAIHNAR